MSAALKKRDEKLVSAVRSAAKAPRTSSTTEDKHHRVSEMLTRLRSEAEALSANADRLLARLS